METVVDAERYRTLRGKNYGSKIQRSEPERSVRSCFQTSTNMSQHTRSSDRYESRIRSVGIKLPESIRLKIRQYLRRDGRRPEPPADGDREAGGGK
ncbi:MAG TPA: hypothetical protein PLB96_08695 [Syntrophales bacterium]|nr:hypothetical protein [Syntrophales bacterium]